MTDINLKGINKIVDSFRKNKKDAEEKAAKIDEEYRRLAEEKKKELIAKIAEFDAEIKFWTETVLPRYTVATKEEAEGVVVDLQEEAPAVEEAPATESTEEEEEEIQVDEKEVPMMEGIPVEEVNIEEKMNEAPVEEIVAEVAETIPDESTVNFEDAEEIPEISSAASNDFDDFWQDTKDDWK